VRPLLRREAHLKALSILLYVCALGTFGGLCVYYALDVTIFNESVVAAEPRAGSDWNCSLIVTHTDTQPASFNQSWLSSAAEASSGFPFVSLSASSNAGFDNAVGAIGAVDFLEISASSVYLILRPVEFLKVSWQTAYFSSLEACTKSVDAALAATPTFEPWTANSGGTVGQFYAAGRWAAADKLPGVNLDFGNRIYMSADVSVQLCLRGYSGSNNVAAFSTPAVTSKVAALAASPFMAAVRTEYIKLICKPFAALKPYSCTRAVIQRRPPLVRARSSAHFPSLSASP
jgi:hypothetical protein